MIKTILKILGVLLLLIGAYVLNLLNIFGVFKSIDNSYPGSIKQVIETVGSEDFAISRADSFLIVSSCDLKRNYTKERTEGHIKYIDLTEQPYQLETLDANVDFPFYPHGVSLLHIDSNLYRLFVVNHPLSDRAKHTIEIFELQDKQLRHVKTVYDELFIRPNDVAAVGPEEFYYTNDHGSTDKADMQRESFLGIPKSHLVHYKNGKSRIAADQLKMANGVFYDAKAEEVYIAASRNRAVFIYDRLEDGDLKLKSKVPCKSVIDNVHADAEGNVWATGHPKLLKYIAFRGDLTDTSIAPSEVVKLTPKGNGRYEVESYYMDDGENISASSIAVPFGNQLFVGNVSDKQMLVLEN